ncbi:MAG: two-component sensor histidine kinase [Actinobacteria bacterium 13_2_20CM_2_71_6]|nr:MAG: two-component sensor histidine kinase [Actinobacteria bacterium 13_2_20CM_2_71_6]
MRRRLVLLVIATTSLVVVAFLVPLALLVRAAAADRAVSGAAVEIQAFAPVVASADTAALQAALDTANAAGPHKVTVFLPDDRVVGAAAPRSPAVAAAASGRSLTADAPGGLEVLVAVAGLPGGVAVIRTFVGDAELYRGVGRAWLVLGLLGLGLLAVSALVADRLGVTLVRPLRAVVAVSHALAGGDLAARAQPGGPPEVRQVGAGLNLLAWRIGELLARERETVADLSHRLRTPLTALRIDVDSLRDPADRARIGRDLDALERTVDDIIRAARRVSHDGPVPACDAAEVVEERVRFWSALADEEQRAMAAVLSPAPVPVRVARHDLSACVDALLGNVFTHTPEGTGLTVRLTGRPGGGGRLVVMDDGPGLPDPAVLQRGRSHVGSTGLGLDIVGRTAHDSGGTVTIGNADGGGALVIVDFGAPLAAGPPTRPGPDRRRVRTTHRA